MESFEDIDGSWDFDKRKPRYSSHRMDKRDKDGIYPMGSGSMLKAQKPYSYPEFYVWKSRTPTHYNAGDYSDRLWQWDHKKYDRCAKSAWGNVAQTFSSKEPAQVEKFLQLYHDDPELVLACIIEGCNVGNGFPYTVVRYFSPALEAKK